MSKLLITNSKNNKVFHIRIPSLWLKNGLITISSLLVVLGYSYISLATNQPSSKILLKSQEIVGQSLVIASEREKTVHQNEVQLLAQNTTAKSNQASKNQINNLWIVGGAVIFIIFILSRITL